MIFVKKGITVRAYDLGHDFQNLVYDDVITVEKIDLYDLMTKTVIYGDREYKDVIEFIAENKLYQKISMFNLSDDDCRTLIKIADAHIECYKIHEIPCVNGEIYIGYYIPVTKKLIVDNTEQQYLRLYARRYEIIPEDREPLDIKGVGAIPRDNLSKEQIQMIRKSAKCGDNSKTFKDLLSKIPKENLYLDIDGEDELVPIEAKMTRIQGIQILRLGHTNYQVGGIRYDAELGKFKTLGGETFRVVYMINPERV